MLTVASKSNARIPSKQIIMSAGFYIRLYQLGDKTLLLARGSRGEIGQVN